MKTNIINNMKIWSLKLSLNYIGLAFGAISYGLSLTPSLLPRPTLYQGLLSGVAFAVGYGFGVVTSWTFRKFEITEPSDEFKKKAWIVLGGLSLVVVVAFSRLSVGWQNEIRSLLDEDPNVPGSSFKVFFLAVIMALLIITVSRLIRLLNRFINRQLGRWLPTKFSSFVGIVLTIILIVVFLNGFLIKTMEKVADNIYSSKNLKTPDNVSRPTISTRSGSDDSLVSWDTIGYQGKEFVSRGPSQKELRDFSGREPKQQIRVYAGINSAPNAKERAELVLKELIRTDAFSREVLVVATATGTGWLEPQSTESLEYIFNGNTAIASMQYSYLPSWMATLVDKDSAAEAGTQLYSTVYDYWKTLPTDARPKLLAYGLSLGSYGSQAAFSGSQDLELRTDGALFIGTPSFTRLWGHFTEKRDRGSYERSPVYDSNKIVGFAATSGDISNLLRDKDWHDARVRVLYMQHGSDPVVWWNTDLIMHRPGWLKEPPAFDVTSKFHWYPIVTFLQVTADQFVGVSPPNGHGHNYADAIVDAWVSITRPSDWTAKDSARLQLIIDEYTNE